MMEFHMLTSAREKLQIVRAIDRSNVIDMVGKLSLDWDIDNDIMKGAI